MTNYGTSEMNDAVYVINTDTGATISGPYKNRKSAVGRISDLKKRDAKAMPLGAALEDATPGETLCVDEGCPNAGTDHVCVNVTAMTAHETARIAATTMAAYEMARVVDMGKPRSTHANAMKLASSSPYGNWNGKPLADAIVPLADAIVIPFYPQPIVRPIGCYPAVSKRAYRR